MTQLERLKQEVKTLLTDIEYLERVSQKQDKKLFNGHLYLFVLSFALFLSNALWLSVFVGG